MKLTKIQSHYCSSALKYRITSGFTLVELLISLTLGLVLVSGVLSVFVGMRSTAMKTSTIGELQENGRFALSVLSNDLSMQNFWGDFAGNLHASNLTSVPPAIVNNCNEAVHNNTAFPSNNSHFKSLWGQSVSSNNPIGCFTDGRVNNATKPHSELIQIKRVIGQPQHSTNPKFFYLTTNSQHGQIHAGGEAPNVILNSRTWLYQNHLYYVREESQGDNMVPVLMQGRILSNKMQFSPIIDGVESIAFVYGIDTTGNGSVNQYIPTGKMTESLWNNAYAVTPKNLTNAHLVSTDNQLASADEQPVFSTIVAVKVYVLVRSLLPDKQYTNTNTYQLGDSTFVANDHYHRLLFSTVVNLYNARR
jgi:type IV pilus assembly protein PilW